MEAHSNTPLGKQQYFLQSLWPQCSPFMSTWPHFVELALFRRIPASTGSAGPLTSWVHTIFWALFETMVTAWRSPPRWALKTWQGESTGLGTGCKCELRRGKQEVASANEALNRRGGPTVGGAGCGLRLQFRADVRHQDTWETFYSEAW